MAVFLANTKEIAGTEESTMGMGFCLLRSVLGGVRGVVSYLLYLLILNLLLCRSAEIVEGTR